MVKERSVGAAVFRKKGNETEFLLLHYIAGHWGLPKGHVEKNETDEQTLFREIKEETSLTDVKPVNGFKQDTSYFFTRKKETVFKEVAFYLVEAKSGQVKLSFEHQGFKWLAFDKAMALLSFSNTKNVLQKANAFLAQKNSENP